jgi:hypothetical protein
MSLCPLFQPMKGVVSADQAERATSSYCIRVVARFAGFVPADMVVQISGYDRRLFKQQACVGAQR